MGVSEIVRSFHGSVLRGSKESVSWNRVFIKQSIPIRLLRHFLVVWNPKTRHRAHKHQRLNPLLN